jgi:hypothetical protein
VLDRLQAHAYKVDRDLQYLRVQNDLLLLDQAWEEESKQYMVRTKSGATVEPSQGHVITGVIAAGIATVVGIVLACPLMVPSRSADPFITPNSGPFFAPIIIFIVIMIAFALLGTIFSYTKYNAYKSAEAKYIARRNVLLSQLNQSQSYSNTPGSGS